MQFTDLPLDQLRAWRPAVREPVDFDAFWAQTVDRARRAGGGPVLEPARTPITELRMEDLTFPGFAGEPVRAWVARPRDEAARPTILEFAGYDGGRGIPGEHVLWALAGFVEVFMDTRGQGAGWGTGGDTPDPHGSGSQVGGWMTKGILDPREHYYRRLYTDALRLVDAVRALPFVDAERVFATGVSQGGGVALAVAGLAQRYAGGLRGVMPDVPFLCDWEHGMEVSWGGPYQELARYLSVHRDRREAVLRTAGYLDAVNFAKRVAAPALFSVALMDEVVPPRTVFAAYNALGSADRDIRVYAYNGHEGGETYQWLEQVRFARARL